MTPTGRLTANPWRLRVGAQTGCALPGQAEYFYTKAAKEAKQTEGLATKGAKCAKLESESVLISVYQWLKIQKAFYTKAAKGAKEAKKAAEFATKYTKHTKADLGSVLISVYQGFQTLLRFPFALIRVSSRLKNLKKLNAEVAESAERLATKGAKCSKNRSELVSIRVHSWLNIPERFYTKAAKRAKQTAGLTTKHTKDTKGLSLKVGAQACCAHPTPFALFPPVNIRFIAWSSRPSRAWCKNPGLFHHGWHGYTRIIRFFPFVTIIVHQWLRNQIYFYTKAAKEAKKAAEFATKYTKHTKADLGSVCISVYQWFQTLLRFPFALIRVYSRLKNQIGLNAEDAENAEGVTTKHTKDTKGGSGSMTRNAHQWFKTSLPRSLPPSPPSVPIGAHPWLKSWSQSSFALIGVHSRLNIQT